MSNETRCERGVYTLPYRSRCGRTQLVAVDRTGCEVTRALVFRGEDKTAVIRMLYNILNSEDPKAGEE
jgi:hypothetical protein